LAEVSFGEWLRRQRKAAGLTQEQLALQISCSTSALKKIEAEERRPSGQIVERLAEIFGISPNERTAFLRFARGDWHAAPTGVESTPWRSPPVREHEDRSKSKFQLVTFLFTDIEGSTKLAQQYPDTMPALLARHNDILSRAIEGHNGFAFQVVGDSFSAAFHTPSDALHAALDAQYALHKEEWAPAPIKVRMGINTGSAQLIEDSNRTRYEGYATMALTQRIMSVAHGGQILISQSTFDLVRDQLLENVQLMDMGEYRLKDVFLPEHLHQLVAPDLPSKFPPLKTIENVSHNLPAQLTSFIGRKQELKEIAKLLSTSRLLTLTGPGGVGKTRLAIETANNIIDKFGEGVFWVGLVDLSDKNLIPQAIAQSLNVREVSNEPLIQTLKSYLKSKDLLLVIDNCEHLIKACAQYVEQLLAACPKLRILATSIEVLGLFNETTWQVPSLPLPEVQQSLSFEELQDFASIELFCERARNVKSGFILDEKNALSVAQICRRLDGIPLAIELAAARIKVLSVDEIAARLDDRFSLLTAGSRTAIPRHQTLRATIDWSYDLLAEPERILLRRLSVFAGGFTLEATEAVGAFRELKQNDVLDLLGRLVDKSLVIVESTSMLDETRYRLLETIREYGREKLKEKGEIEKVHDQHLAYYVRLAQVSAPHIFGEQTARWFTRLDQELDNIRLAIDWSSQCHKMTEAFLLLGSLDYFFFVHGPISEWQERLHRALSMPGGQEPTLARARALNGVGMLYWADINSLEGYPNLQEALEIALQLGDKEIAASALRNLGLFEHLRGNLTKARALLEQSLNAWLELGPSFMFQKSWTLNFLGDVAFSQGDLNQALLFFEESTAVLREFKDKAFLAYAIRRLAQLAIHRGNTAHAILLCRESLLLNVQVNDPRGILACVSTFAAIQLSLGRFASAVQLFAAVQDLLNQRALFRLLQIDQMEYERNLALLHTQVDKQTLATFWTRGSAMTLENAISYLLESSES
jgi:predicted ATPase/class 3 adenylate cyclase/DNA-binding XRE family transcriptional regulator